MNVDWIGHLWESTVFAVMVALLSLAFRRNRADVRYWLWYSASLKFLVPFALLFGLGRQIELAPATSELASPALQLAKSAAPTFSTEQLVLPLAMPVRFDWPIWLWGCGFVLIAGIRLRGWLLIRAAVASSVSVGAADEVPIRRSASRFEPGVVGIWRPILLVPAGMEALQPEQWAAVIAHELCHVRRRDNLLATVHMLVEALFWFHPAVWWIGARLVQERERACDEEVVRIGNSPFVYAEAIVSVCSLCVESPVACVSGVTGSDLKKRIQTIVQNRKTRPLGLVQKSTLAGIGVFVLALPVLVGAAQKATFDVVSIRSCQTQAGMMTGAGSAVTPGTLNTGCIQLVDENHLGLIQRAYVRFANGRPNSFGVLPIRGGPPWIRSEMFLIQAKADGAPTPAMMQGPMFQALLEDRFRLKVHRQTEEAPVYALTLAGGTSKLKPFRDGECLPPPASFPAPPLAAGERYCRVLVRTRPSGVEAEGSTMADFAKLLDLFLDRPVLDRTGLSGRFQMRLDFAIDETTSRILPPGTPIPAEDHRPAIFAALQEQLGLKLVRVRGPREFLMIDHVERPSEN